LVAKTPLKKPLANRGGYLHKDEVEEYVIFLFVLIHRVICAITTHITTMPICAENATNQPCIKLAHYRSS